jgi:biotin transport system substrate-specific component
MSNLVIYWDSRPALRDLGGAAGFSFAIAIGANVAIPLPFTPVPVTLQSLAVLFTAAALGARRGTLAVMLYILEGAAGLPVFSGGRAGLAMLFGPTGGYIAGFVAAALVAGSLSDAGWTRGILRTAALFLAGGIALFAPGVLWLSGFVGAGRALSLGLLPFLPGEAVKLAAFCAAAGVMRPVMRSGLPRA